MAIIRYMKLNHLKGGRIGAIILIFFITSISMLNPASAISGSWGVNSVVIGENCFHFTIIDDVNVFDQNLIDEITAEIYSDSDAGGINIPLLETGPDTQVFQSDTCINLTVTGQGGRELIVAPGDNVYFSYLGTIYATAIITGGDVDTDGDG